MLTTNYLRKKYQHNQQGIGLVEVILALGLAVIVITSLVSLSIYTMRASLQSKLALEGTKIANRELELIRALRDSMDSWKTGEPANPGFVDLIDGTNVNSVSCYDVGNPCHMEFGILVPPVAGVCSQTVDNNSNVCNQVGQEVIHRSFYVTYISDDVMRISVAVTWNVGNQTKGTYVYTDLTNWK